MENKERPIFLPTFIGFTIYDFIHLICSSIVLGLAYATREGVWYIEVAKASSEIAFSLLLVAFIVSMVRQRRKGDEVILDKAYFFAWLTAAAGLALSSSCMIPYLLMGSEAQVLLEIEITCFSLSIVFVAGAFVCFFVALMLANGRIAKHVMAIVGMALLAVSIPLCVAGDCFYDHSPVDRVFTIIADLAPIFAIAGGLHNEIRGIRFLRKN